MQDGRASLTTLTLMGPKSLLFMVKALYFESSGRTNNCHIEVLFKWSDQSCTPYTAHDMIIMKKILLCERGLTVKSG